MKIALCTEVLYPLFGVERRVYEMAKRLPKYGFDVTVYTSSSGKHFPELNIKQVSRSTITDPPKRNYATCIYFCMNLMKNLMKDEYDIIDANGHMVLMPCSAAGLLRKKPVVATIHDLYLTEWREMYKGLGSMFGMPWEIASSKMRFTKIITLNKAMKSKMTDILHIRNEKIEIIPSGIDLKKIDRIKAKKKEKMIVYVGRLVPQKNIDVLIKAFSMLGRMDVQLRIIGDGSERKNLETLSKDLGLKNITFTGRLKEYSDMIREMKQATMLVLPSQRENFGIVPIESMACGTPVVSSNTEGPRDYIKNGSNGFLTGIRSAQEIKERMEILLDNKTLRNMIIKNGRKTAENYDWDNIVKRIADVYKELE